MGFFLSAGAGAEETGQFQILSRSVSEPESSYRTIIIYNAPWIVSVLSISCLVLFSFWVLSGLWRLAAESSGEGKFVGSVNNYLNSLIMNTN